MNKKILVIIVVVLIVVIGGLVYASKGGKTVEPIIIDKKVTVDDTVEDAPIVKNGFDSIIAKSPTINLRDVSKSGALGIAWLGVYEGKTYHRITVKNLPTPPGTDFYEGWLVKNPLTKDYFSTGKMEYNPSTKEAQLDFLVEGDKSGYKTVVITSERDDGNPKPGKHALEERFPSDTNFQVTLDTVLNNPAAQ